MCMKFVRRTGGGGGLSALAAALCLVISFCGVNSRMTATEPQYPPTLTPVTYAQQVNRTLTIGQVTVELHYANHSGSILEVHHSYRTTHPSGEVHSTLGGYSVTRADGSSTEIKTSVRDKPDVGEAYRYDIGAPIAEKGELLNISAGTYIIPAPEVTATTVIEFEPDFGKNYNATLDLPVQLSHLRCRLTRNSMLATADILSKRSLCTQSSSGWKSFLSMPRPERLVFWRLG